jgi:hypothetical protein
MVISNLAAQEEDFRRPPADSFSVDADGERPIVPGSNLLGEDEETIEEKKPGFPWITLPKPKLPTLPKPSLPKLSLPTWGTTQTTQSMARSRAAEEPSAWEKLNSGTKSFFSKTKQTLMPWTADEESSTARKKSSPTRRTARATTSKPKQEKKPFFSSWLETRTEEKPIETVNDYLALPRVPYE